MKWSFVFVFFFSLSLLCSAQGTLPQESWSMECRDDDGDGWPEWYTERFPGRSFHSPFAILEQMADGLDLSELQEESDRWPSSSGLQALVARKLQREGRVEESLRYWKRAKESPDLAISLEAATQFYKSKEWGEAFATLGESGALFHEMYIRALQQHPITAEILQSGWQAFTGNSLTRKKETLFLEPLGPLGESRIKMGGRDLFLNPRKGYLQILPIGLQIRIEPEWKVTNLAAELAGDQGVSEELGRSVEGRPIRAYWLGGGEETVVFFGAFHGDEPESADVCEKFLNYLRENPDLLEGKTAVIVPVVNPDGLNKETRLNANTVDLNRNFPTENWTGEGEGTDYWGGDEPASEPETEVVIEVLERFKPARIVSIHCPYKCVNYDGPAEKLAAIMSEENGYKIEPSIGYPTPGSFGNYAGVEGGIPTITLELPPTGEEDVWEDNRQALVRALRGE